MLLVVVGALGCLRMIGFILTVGLSLTWLLLLPLLCCDPCLTVDGSEVLSDPGRIDEQFGSAWLRFFCRAGRSAVDPSVFDREVGGWLPHLGEFDFPPLLGSDLYQVVQHKRASAGGLGGWRVERS